MTFHAGGDLECSRRPRWPNCASAKHRLREALRFEHTASQVLRSACAIDTRQPQLGRRRRADSRRIWRPSDWHDVCLGPSSCRMCQRSNVCFGWFAQPLTSLRAAGNRAPGAHRTQAAATRVTLRSAPEDWAEHTRALVEAPARSLCRRRLPADPLCHVRAQSSAFRKLVVRSGAPLHTAARPSPAVVRRATVFAPCTLPETPDPGALATVCVVAVNRRQAVS